MCWATEVWRLFVIEHNLPYLDHVSFRVSFGKTCHLITFFLGWVSLELKKKKKKKEEGKSQWSGAKWDVSKVPKTI